MANRNLSSAQLDMWKPARELRGMHLSDASVYLSNHGLSSASSENVKRARTNVMRRKVRESKKSGLYDSIKEQGVEKPVEVFHDWQGATLMEGHHRVASAMSIDPNSLVPVRHQWRQQHRGGGSSLIL
jgi:hypothetical protein